MNPTSLTLRPPLPLFDGTTKVDGPNFISPEDFLRRAEDEKLANKWSNEEAMRQVASSLRGAASEWYRCGLRPTMTPALYEHLTKDFEMFKSAFKEQYCYTGDLGGIDWSGLKQKHDETPAMFATRVLVSHQTLMDRVNMNFKTNSSFFTEEMHAQLRLIEDTHARELLMQNIIKAAEESKILFTNHYMCSVTMKMVSMGLGTQELRDKALQLTRQKDKLEFSQFSRILTEEALLMKNKKKICEVQEDEHDKDKKTVEEVEEKKKKWIKCNYCKKIGHLEKSCYKKERKKQVGNQQMEIGLPSLKRAREEMVTTHVSLPTPTWKTHVEKQNCKRPHVFKIANIDEAVTSGNRVFISLQLKGKQSDTNIQCLYDTGACVSVLTPPAFREACRKGAIKKEILNHRIRINNASGTPMQVSGVFEVEFYLKGKRFISRFVVSEDACSNIIGMNIIRQCRLMHDIFQDSVEFCQNQTTMVQSIEEDDWEIVLTERVTIQPRQARLITACLRSKLSRKKMTEARQFMGHLDLISVAATTNEFGNFKIHYPNATDEPWTLERGFQIGIAEPLDAWKPIRNEPSLLQRVAEISKETHRSERNERTTAIEAALRKSLERTVPLELRQSYMSMLMKNKNVFSSSKMDLGQAHDMEHKVELKDNDPVFVQQFRLPQQHLQTIKENVVGWLQAGVIEPAISRYNSPIFCVPKKGSTELRCVLDYRQVNEKTILDKYSIRTIDECVEQVGRAGSKVFSCLDLTSGFWQLRLTTESRPYTAFTIPGMGQYQWIMSPMGLHGTPGTFSRLMDAIMAEAQNVVTFMDDILIHSHNHKAHLQHLKDALLRLAKAGLKLNPNKCIFGAEEVEYLGHTITSKGVRPGKDKTQAIKEAPQPVNQKQLKSFIGLINYFRGYITNFARRAAPLYKLTRQDSPWTQGPLPERAKDAFLDLRTAITGRPVLAFPNPRGQYHLYVDAALGDEVNEGGLGAVLMQEDSQGRQHPVGYASRRLADHEKNYPAFIAEMTAACFGMEFFHHYLIGRRFSLYTDHKPLTKISKIHKKTLSRLQLNMQELHPDICYIEGKDNVVADFLSRYEGLGISQVDASPTRISQMQQKDPEMKEIWRKGAELTRTRKIKDVEFEYKGQCKRDFKMSNGVLYVIPPNRKGILQEPGKRQAKIATPQALWKELMQAAHGSKFGGHSGIFKMSERIRQNFWWPGLDEEVKDFIQSCEPCQRASNKSLTPPPPLQPLPETTRPNQRVHIDLFGSLKSSTNKNHFVLVITDAFTKFTRLVPIPDKAASTVTQALLDHFIYIFGVPERIISDQGNEFCSQFQKLLWESLDIQHDVTTPYHPQTNASAEVFNKTMAHYLATALLESEKSTLDWELYLGPLMFSYNTAVNKSTKVTPFGATFGYDPRVPLWEGVQHPNDDQLQGDGSFADHLAHLRMTQYTARKVVHHNSQHARQSYQDQHDKHQENAFPSYEPGDSVWIRINQKNWPNPKISPKWEKGTVMERKSVAVYRVRQEDRKKRRIITINAQLLKPRVPEQDEDQDPPSPGRMGEKDPKRPGNCTPRNELKLHKKEEDHKVPYSLRTRNPKGARIDAMIEAVARSYEGQGVDHTDLVRLMQLGYILTGFLTPGATPGREPTHANSPQGPSEGMQQPVEGQWSGTQHEQGNEDTTQAYQMEETPPPVKRRKSFKHLKNRCKDYLRGGTKDHAPNQTHQEKRTQKSKVSFPSMTFWSQSLNRRNREQGENQQPN